jgi:Spy/CpxP family protein refolding chaperone
MALLLVVVMAGVSMARRAGQGHMGGRADCGPADCQRGPGIERFLTTEQMEKVGKVRGKYHDQRAEIFTKMATLRGEMRDLLSQPEPDFGKVGERIDAMSDLRARLARMRLEQHKEIRGLLTDEQRAIFDRRFADADGDGPDGIMGCGPMGGGMACGGAGGPGCAMACEQMGGGMACGGAGGPGCAMACERMGGAPGCAVKCTAAPGGQGMPGCGMQAGKAMPGSMPGCEATCKVMQGAAPAAGGCPMAGAMGSGLGVRPQSGEWRRWL